MVGQTLFHLALASVCSTGGGFFIVPAVADFAGVQVRPAVGADFEIAHAFSFRRDVFSITKTDVHFVHFVPIKVDV